MTYVDAYVLPVVSRKLAAYRRVARLCGKVWREHGALQYRECLGDDLLSGPGLAFPKLVKPKRGEVIVVVFVTYRSRVHRDRVNTKVLKDPRLADLMRPGAMPFDVKRMAYGGFKVFVDA